MPVMRKTLQAILGLPVCAALLSAADLTPPPTKIDPVTETLHGVKITDPYRWLESQDSPETRAWLAEQDKFARRYLDSIPDRGQIRKALESLQKIDRMGAPILRNSRYFFSRRLASEDRNSLLMRRGYKDNDEVLVDPNTVSPDPASSVSYRDVTPDGGMVAFGIRRGGEDETEIRLMDVATRKVLPDVLPRGRYFSFRIKPDKSGFYYSRFVVGQGSRVYRHAMGSQPSEDREVFGRGYGPTQNVGFDLSVNGRWLILEVAEGVPAAKMELYVKDLESDGPIQSIVKADAEFDLELAGDRLLLNTNWNAPNRKIFSVDLKNPSRDRWKEIVPEAAQAITDASAAGGRLFVGYLENVTTRIKQFNIDGKYLGDLKLPGIGTTSVPMGRWEDDQAFFTFTSFVEPASTYRVIVSTGTEDLWFRPRIPVHTENIETHQIWYTSKDGTKVPMFLVHQKGISLDGNRPVLLTGYGGFNLPSLPAFSAIAAWWTEQGGVYAVANLRGGGEFGESWHKAGMFEKKQNVFDDFIAAAEWLIRNRYTNPGKLGIRGVSNGGLLMGAMMTQRPDLFGAIVCGAPLLDMLRYQKLSVGAWWTSEYGSADDPKQFEYLHKYSPYHNVRRTKYPAILFSTGDADTRVDPSHARKMTALVQASNTADTPVILRYDAKGGHSGIGSVDKTIEEQVDWIGFLCDRLGVKIP
jgi:prolyl oligopeptidase